MSRAGRGHGPTCRRLMPSVGTLHVTASLASVLVPLRARPLTSPHCATPNRRRTTASS